MGAHESKPRHELCAPSVTGRPTVVAAPLPEAFLAAVKALPDDVYARFQLPGSPEYKENNQAWNFDAVGSPSAIFQPTSEEQIAAFLKLWASAPLPAPHSLSVAGGRHSHYGQKDHAIVLDMQKFDSVAIDTEKKEGTFGAGLKLRAFDSACKKHGLATTAGTNPDTGIAGLTLGGGFGHLCRRHGLTVDNLLAVRVVLCSGEVVTATHDNEHAELLWGLSGGGGNFGVVTAFTYRLHERGDVLAGATVFLTRKLNNIPAILSAWVEAGRNAHNDLSLMCVIPSSGPSLIFPTAYVGHDMEEGKRLLAPIRKIGNPTIDTIKVGPYCDGPKPGADLQASAESQQGPGNWYESGVLLRDLPPEAIAVLLRYTSELAPNKDSHLVLATLGGAVREKDPEASAVGFRTAHFVVMILGKWPNQPSPAAYIAERKKVVAWVKSLLRAMAPFSVASYNTLGDVELDAVKTKALEEAKKAGASASAAAAASGPPVSSPADQPDPAVPVAVPVPAGSAADVDELLHEDAVVVPVGTAGAVPVAVNFKSMASWSDSQYQRLVKLKQRYDPTNVFRNCNNIRPTPK